MRPLIDCDTIQIEITNACHKKCSNCTRLVGHHPQPYFMNFETFKNAVDSMVGYPKMTGVMGGEPLLHPEFEKLCEYLNSKIPREQCGLWTCFPEGKEHYREIIARTFGNIFLNDQTRDDILHGPVLVASEEIKGSDAAKWYHIDKCWVQMYWSAAINPKGAFFCEIAASMAMLFGLDDHKGWEVKKRWWEKIPKDFTTQMEKYCLKCGCAMPLRKRYSIDGKDDISPKMYEMLKDVSPKLKQGKYVINSQLECEVDNRKTATYKDWEYRQGIAGRYGMFVKLNKMGFNEPILKSDWRSNVNKKPETVLC